MDITVRRARSEDAASIANLMSQLGYDVPVEIICRRLESMSPMREVLIAFADSKLAGWIAISVQNALVTGRDSLIEGLVVDQNIRGRRIGSRLLAAAGAWAREHGCHAVRVQSNVVREAAHRFYERHGYERLKTQHHFVKKLG